MNADLIPFYETAHVVLNKVSSPQPVLTAEILKGSRLHANQFNLLLNLLSSLQLIDSSPKENKEFVRISKGSRWDKYKTWLPDNTSDKNSSRNEYYLLYLEYQPNQIKRFSFPKLNVRNSQDVYLIPKLLTYSDLFKCSLEIKKQEHSYFTINYSNIPKILPYKLKIFDLVRIKGYTTTKTITGFQNLVDQELEKYSEFDSDVLKSFGNDETNHLDLELSTIKLPYFETYFRLNHYINDFENALLHQLDQKDFSERKISSDTVLTGNEIIYSDTLITPGHDSRENTKKETIKDEDIELKSQPLFRYGYYTPTIKDYQIEPCFDVGIIATVLTEQMASLKCEHGQMVGIFGKWGRGKTYFKNEIAKVIADQSSNHKFKMIDFHAWKYQDTPAVWAYLYESLSKKYLGKNWFRKYCRKIKLNFKREGSDILGDTVFIAFIWAILVWLFNFVTISANSVFGSLIEKLQTHSIEAAFGGTLITYLIQFFRKEGTNARDLLKKYTKGISFNKHLGVQAEIEKEMVTLLKCWIPKDSKERIILFVDDIDRCSENKIIELVDSLRVMLEHPEIVKRLIVLVAIDEEKLAMAIQYKYKDLYSQTNENKETLELLCREYMDKLFISGIKLQPLALPDVNEFITTLVEQDWKDRAAVFSEQSEIDIENKETQQTEMSEQSITKDQTSDLSIEDNDEADFENGTLTVLMELSSEDVIQLFENELKKVDEELTPRQIRILYYRFQLAKNLFIRITKAEEDQLITDQLKDLLETIRYKTFNREARHEDPLINSIAEMVVGY